MNSLPLATVAMVTYNSGKYVAEAIESVLSQSYENLELIICDDCSIDNTWNIIASYTDSRIRAYRNSFNLREYPNRNQALTLAKGEYIVFIDGDDILYPHGLEFMVKMLHAFPNSAVAVCRPWNEKILYPFEVSPRHIYLIEYIGTGILGINFTQILFNTRALKEVGGFNTTIRTGDTYIQFKLALHRSFLVINEGNAWWRRSEGQASEAVLKGTLGFIETTKYRLDFLNASNSLLTEREKEIALKNLYGIYYRSAARLLLKGRFTESFSLFRALPFSLDKFLKIFSKADFSFLNQFSASKPLTSGIAHSPYFKGKPV